MYELIYVLMFLLCDPRAAEGYELGMRARALPDVDQDQAMAFSMVAVVEERPFASAELLVALGWAESRFRLDAEPGCGALQVFPRDLNRPQSDCFVWKADLVESIKAGVVEIDMLLADRRVKHDLHDALMYRACGGVFFVGTCHPSKAAWVHAVEKLARRLAAPRWQVQSRALRSGA